MGATSETYNDQQADIVLEDTGGMRYHVHSYVLRSGSTVFHDMFATVYTSTESKPGDQSSPIPIQVESQPSATALWLDLMHNKPSTKHPLRVLQDALALSEKYACAGVADRILLRMQDHADKEPWELFKIASRFDNLFLARSCLAKMGSDRWQSNIDNSKLNEGTTAGLTRPYLLAFVRVMADVSHEKVCLDGAWKPKRPADWAEVSRRFQP